MQETTIPRLRCYGSFSNGHKPAQSLRQYSQSARWLLLGAISEQSRVKGLFKPAISGALNCLKNPSLHLASSQILICKHIYNVYIFGAFKCQLSLHLHHSRDAHFFKGLYPKFISSPNSLFFSENLQAECNVTHWNSSTLTGTDQIHNQIFYNCPKQQGHCAIATQILSGSKSAAECL